MTNDNQIRTLKEENDPQYTGVDRCSSLDTCYSLISSGLFLTMESDDNDMYDNTVCNSRESCGKIIKDNASSDEISGCILS